VTAVPANAAFPTSRLLLVVASTAAALVVLWTVVKVGGLISEDVYRGGVLGLLCATASNLVGTFAGSFFAARMSAAAGKGDPLTSAYLASTTVRFIATPALALSLYFLLPQKPTPLLLSAAAGHLLIMVADIATLLRFVQGSARSSAPNA
jgi:hypothetical protein